MPMTYSPGRTNFGLLPEPEGRSVSFITSSLVNLTILGVILYVGMTAKHVLEQHYEMTELIVPSNPPPPVKIKQPPPPEMPPPPQQPKLQLELQPKQIEMPKPKPEPKPVQMEAKLTVPEIKQARPQIVLQPQPKAALAAAMPAQNNMVKPSTAPVHLGQTFGVTPNPNATRPATVAAIGNPVWRHAGPRNRAAWSCGFNRHRKSAPSSAPTPALRAKWPRPAFLAQQRTGNTGNYGKVASAGIPVTTPVAAAPRSCSGAGSTPPVEVLSKPP